MIIRMVKLTQTPLDKAVKLAILSTCTGDWNRTPKGRLVKGFDADIVVFDNDIRIQ